MRKTNLFIGSLVLFVMLFTLTGCEFFNSGSTTEPTNKIKALSISGETTHEFTEGDELILEDLKGIILKVTYTVDEAESIDLGDITELPEGMKIDKLGKTLSAGQVTVTVSYKVGGVTKKATFTITVAKAPGNELTELKAEAEGLRLEVGEKLTLAALKGLKVTAKYTLEDDVVYDFSKLTELPAGLTIEKLGENLEVGKQNIKVTLVEDGVTKEATFEIEVYEEKVPEGTLVLEEIPESKIMLEAQKALAKAHVNIQYGEEGLVLTAFVEDAKIISSGSIFENDSIELALDKSLRMEGYSDHTLSIIVDAAGHMQVKNLKTGEVVAEHTITSEVKMFSLDGKKIAGYKVVINVPYAETQITKEAHDAVLMVLLSNFTDDVLQSEVVYNNQLEEDYNNINTYAELKEDGTLGKNKYSQLGVVWGNAGSLVRKPEWNINNDDGTENREIHNEANNADNNIYMHGTNTKEYYAEVKINVKQLLNGELYGKFGLSVTREDGSTGFFFYVDAMAADGINFNENSVALGYNTSNNGKWDNSWANIDSLGGTSAQYQGDNYVTFGIYRYGSIFGLYANGRLIKYVSCGIAEGDTAYVGIVAFNMLLSAKEYFVEKEDLEQYRIHKENLDYLFLGDSYMDTAFYYNWGNTFGKLSARNIGVGGTKVEYWQDQLLSVANLYNPQNIIIHIGVNNIDDGNTTGQATWTKLQAMLEQYHAKFPEAVLHYITISHNMMFKAKWGEYNVLNAAVKEYAADKGWLQIVDLDSQVVAENGSTMRWYNGDGLHLGVDGYALLTKLICESLGLEYDLADQAGDVAVTNAPMLVHSPGWEVITEGEETVYHNAGRSFDRIGSESQLFINGLYGNTFYAEVQISLEECYCATDEWPKTGIALRSATGTYFLFVNSSTVTNKERVDGQVKYTDNWGNVMYRPEVSGRNWTSELFGYFATGLPGYDHKFDHSYTTLGIARIGSRIAFYANGNLVAFLENSEIPAEELSAVSVFTFNMNAYVKGMTFTTELSEVQAKMPAHKVTLPQANAAYAVSAQEENYKEGQKVELTVTPKQGITVTEVKANNVLAQLNEETGKYEFIMPAVDVTITVKITGDVLVVDPELLNGLNINNAEPNAGDKVELTVKEGWIVEQLLLNGEALALNTDTGKYEFIYEGYKEVTGKVVLPADQIQIDGELDELYGEVYDHFFVQNNRDVTVYARKGYKGVYIYVIAHTNKNVTDGNEWYNNHNFEFELNRGGHLYVSNQGDAAVKHGSVAEFVRSSQLLEEGSFAGKYEHRYEFFVPKENIKDWSLFGEVELGYAYKAIEEPAHHEGQSYHTWFDNYWQTTTSAINDRLIVFGAGESHPGNLFITNNGLRINQPVVANNGTIDGNLEEFADVHGFEVTNDLAKYILKAYVAADGLYVGGTIYSKNISHDRDEWHLNDNVEMQYNGTTFAVAFYDQFVSSSYGNVLVKGHREELTEGEMYDAGYRYVSVFEYFIPGLGEGEMSFSSNGAGFRDGAWLPFYWNHEAALYGTSIHVGSRGLGTLREVNIPSETSICKVTSNMDKAFAGEEIVIALELKDAVTVTAVKLNGEALQKGEDDKYHFLMPAQNATITVEFDTLLDASKVTEFVTIDNMNPELGSTITITQKDQFLMKSLTVNGEAVEITNGTAQVVVNGKIVLDGEFCYEADDIQIDLTLDALYGEVYDHFWVAGNRDVTVYARKGYKGVYIYVIAHTNENHTVSVVNNPDDINNGKVMWYSNDNFEFKINQGDQMFVSDMNDQNTKSDNVTELLRSTVLLTEGDFAGKYEHRYEFFIAKENIKDWNQDGELEFGYAYKAINEYAHHEGQSWHTWKDNYWQTTTSAINARLMNFGAGESHPGKLFITNNGLRINQTVVANNGTIDGNLEEFENVYGAKAGDAKAQYDIRAYVAADGLYIGGTIYSKNISHDNEEWHLNDNIEMYYNGVNIVVAFFDKFIKQNYGNTLVAGYRQELTEGEMYDAGYRYVSVFEYFIPGVGDGEISISSNGAGFREGAWLPIYWGGQTTPEHAHVDATGIRALRNVILPEAKTYCIVSSSKANAYRGEDVAISLSLANGVEALAVKMNGNALGKGEDGKYHFTMPDQNATITVELNTPVLNIASGIKNLININKTEPNLGDEVIISAKEGYQIKQLLLNGEALTGEDGTYKFTFASTSDVTGVVLELVDYLFLGDSYMDPAFYYNWGDAFGAYDAKNIGVGGTKVAYWQDKLAEVSTTYNPGHIIMHLVVNDIDEAVTTTGEVGWERLHAMLDNYHEAMPDTVIHYITVSHNMLLQDRWTDYDTLNASVKAYAEGKDWLQIIDLAAEVTADEADSTMRWYNGDGLHLGIDGYALLSRMIKESLGLADGLTGVLGDLNVEEAPLLVSSPGWVLEDGIYHNTGKAFNRVGGESQIFFNGLYATEFYAEVKISLGDCYAPDDNWAKTGLAIRTSTGTYFYIINSAKAINNRRTDDGHVIYDDQFGNLFYRPDVINRNWSAALINQYFYLQGGFDHYTYNQYLTMGIARMGQDIALYANGVMVAYYPNALLGKEELTAVSLMTFNMDVYAKDAYYTTDKALVAAKFAKDATIDGKFDDAIYQGEAMNNVMSFDNKSDGRHVELSGVKGSDGAYLKLVTYSYANTRNSSAWYENANVEFRFGNKDSQTYAVYFNGIGFGRTIGFYNVFTATGKSEQVGETNVYRTEVEIFVPNSEFGGFTDELPIKVWGWVFDGEGWSHIMNIGGYPELTLSENGLRYLRDIVVPEQTSVSKVIAPAHARKGDQVEVQFELASGVEVEGVKVNGESISKDEESGKWLFTMPDQNVTITVAYNNLLDINGISEYATVDNDNPKAGDVITITPKNPWIMKSLKNGSDDVVVLENGIAKVTVNAKVVLTGVFKLQADDIVIDEVLEQELYGEPVHFWVEGNRDVTLYAAKGIDGVYFYVIAHTNENITDGVETDVNNVNYGKIVWYLCNNLEFRFNNTGGTMHISNVVADGVSQVEGISNYKMSSVKLETGDFAGKWEHIYEFLVPAVNIPGWTDLGELEFGYAYKAPAEPARFEGQSFNQWGRDNFWQTTTGALFNRFVDMYEGEKHPGNLFVGLTGLNDKSPKATEVVLDGNLDDDAYAGKASITLGNENAKFIITGFSTPNSLYFGIKIYQKQIADPVGNWWENDNLQINYGVQFQNLGFSIFDKFIVGTWQTKHGMTRTLLTEGEMHDAGYNYETVVEYFIPGISAGTLQFGCNGLGFGGWQALLWDSNWGYVDDTGVYADVWDASAIKTRNGINIDGKFNEAYWTDEVVGHTWSIEAQGSYVKVMGLRIPSSNTIMIAYTIYHTHDINTPSQEDGSAWWHYIGPEFRINWNADQQLAVTNWNHSLIGFNRWEFGSETVENTEGGTWTYKTTFEIAIYASGYKPDYCSFCPGGVFNNGFAWLWKFNWVLNITQHGMVLF